MSLFATALRGHGNALLAIDDTGTTLTHAQAANAAAKWRERIGPGKQLTVLLCKNTTPILEAYFGLVGAGHAVMLLGADTNAAAVADVESRFRPNWFIAPQDGGIEIRKGSDDTSSIHPDLSIMLSTSGSTGTPKFARFTEAALHANAASIVEYLGLTCDERAMAHLPLQYSFGISIVNSHALAGGTLLLTQRSLMDASFWARMENENATSLSGVPFHIEMLLRLRFERRKLPALRTITQAGGKLKADIVGKFADIADSFRLNFFVMYGQTEAGPRVTYLPSQEARSRAGSVGLPIPGVALSLLDDDGRPIAAADTEGELQVKSPSIMMGYALCRDDLTKGDELRGELVTGDLARRDTDGYYWITGRRSRFIKLQGNRISLDTIEGRLHDLGHEVVCVGQDDELYIVVEHAADCGKVSDLILTEFTFPTRSVTTVATEVPRSDAKKINYIALLAAARQAAAERAQ
jgi:long-chain acyl-CoA synthetase